MRIAILIILVLLNCASVFCQEDSIRNHIIEFGKLKAKQYRNETLVIHHVNVIPMTGDTILSNKTVVVVNGRIALIDDTNNFTIKRRYESIDGRGKYLIPGLTDMHVHLKCNYLDQLEYLMAGVTVVRNMSGNDSILKEKKAILQYPFLPLPFVYTSGSGLNGESNSLSVFVNERSDIEAIIVAQADSGYDFIKIYSDLNEQQFRWINKYAKQTGLQVVGHLPHDVSIREAARQGFYGIEHLEGYTLENLEEEIGITTKAGIWNCPTLSGLRYLMEYNSSSRPRLFGYYWPRLGEYLSAHKEVSDAIPWGHLYAIVNHKDSVFKAMISKNALIVSGTDAGLVPWATPGSSLHAELSDYQWLGMKPYKVLETTTVNPARMLHHEAEWGTIEENKIANLVLLDKNPLEDIQNLSSIRGIVLRGAWITKEELTELIHKCYANTGW